jgi:diacylglycerol kinase (ATP)
VKPKPGGVCVVFNPAAKGEKARHVRDRIHALSPDAVVRETRRASDCGSLAARAVREGFGTIVAAGGDGTVNGVVNGIVGAPVRLGILPVGTMNLFAAELGIPPKLEDAWRVIASGHHRTIDLARAGDHHFVQIAGIGLDAQVVKETDPGFRKNFGPLSYMVSLAQIAARQPPDIRVRTAEGEERRGTFVLIGNGRYYGAPIPIFRDARPDDGLLDVLVFQGFGHLEILRYLQGIVFGTHLDMHDVDYLQTRSVSAESACEVPVEADGEVIGDLPMEFGIADSPLRVLVPAPAPAG